MMARQPDRLAGYEIFTLAVDDLEWTKHWLAGLRCDQLLVFVARDTVTRPTIRIRAVESKGTTKVEPVQTVPSSEPFREAVEQVGATLDALWEILAPEGRHGLVEDMRFASFIEHLAAVALSALHPLHTTDRAALNVLRVISELSARSNVTDLALDGVAVCTQYKAAVEPKVQQYSCGSRGWPVFLVRAGSEAVDMLVGAEVASLAVSIADASTSAGTEQRAAVKARLNAFSDSGAEAFESEGGRTSAVGRREQVARGKKRGGRGRSEVASHGAEEFMELAQDLHAACTQRGFALGEPREDGIVVGSSTVAVSMEMRAGGSIKPIEAALDDLAREVAVPSISVENDPSRAFYIRFLVARKNRVFPQIPEGNGPVADLDGQSYLGLYLGQTLEGADFVSYVSSWPHMLVGGTTGSGKTTFIKSLLRQLGRLSEGQVELVVVDGKGEVDYWGIVPPGHFVAEYPEVVSGHQQVPGVLEWVTEAVIPKRRAHMLDRAKKSREAPKTARELLVRTLASGGVVEPFRPLVVVIDEFAEIMLADRKGAQEFEHRVQQIAQIGRSLLVHLLLATQRPDASIVRGAIKANLDARVALRLPTHHDSMTILGGKGAERLLGRGDLIFQASGQPAVRLQGYSS